VVFGVYMVYVCRCGVVCECAGFRVSVFVCVKCVCGFVFILCVLCVCVSCVIMFLWCVVVMFVCMWVCYLCVWL